MAFAQNINTPTTLHKALATGIAYINHIQNTEVHHFSGARRVCFSPDGFVRSVMTAQRFGYFPSISTYQEAKIGDLVFELQWFTPKPFVKKGTSHMAAVPSRKKAEVKVAPTEKWVIYRVKNDKEGMFLSELDMNEANDLWPLLRANKEIDKWMKIPYGGVADDHFLPAGQGWDGKKTVYEIGKEKKLAIFLGKIGIVQPYLSELLKKALVSPGKNMPMNWLHAEALPTMIDMFYTDHRVITMVEVEGEWHDVGVAKLVAGEKNHHIVLENNVSRMVEIHVDCYERGREKYGCRWYIYAKK